MPKQYNKYLYDLIRTYIKDFYNESSNRMIMPKHVSVANIEIEGLAKTLLFDTIDLMLNSNFISDASRFYLKKCTYGSMQECLNREIVPESFNTINKFNSKVTYDKSKINKSICDYDTFDTLLKYCNNLDDCTDEIKEQYNIVRDNLNRLISKEYHNKLYDNGLVIRVNKNLYNETLSDEEWKALKSELHRYSVERTRKFCNGEMIGNVDCSKLIGYYNFLTTERNLREVDKIRLKELKSTLNIHNMV